MSVGLTLIASLLLSPIQEPPRQEINNLVLPPEAKTSPLGKLGHVEKFGNGPIPMILLPGAPFGWSVWKPFMERNKDRYTMYAITVPGYDGTPSPAEPEKPNYEEYTWSNAVIDAVIDLVKKEKLDKPIIVGHHLMADTYAVRAAVKESGLFRGVVIVAGQMTWPMQSAADRTKPADAEERVKIAKERWAKFYKTVPVETFKANQFPASQFSKNADHAKKLWDLEIASSIPIQVRYFVEYMTTNLNVDLPKLTVPTLILDPTPPTIDDMAEQLRSQIEKTGMTVEKWKEQMKARGASFGTPYSGAAKLNAKIAYATIDKTGIFIMDDQPQEFDKKLSEFVGSLGKTNTR